MTVKRKNNNILGIDRGSKYIGLAYCQEGESVVFPVGYLLNTESVLFDLSDVLVRYNVKKIVIWWPSKQEDVQKKINKFVESVQMMLEKKILIEKIEEDYSTTKAWEILSNFKKNAATDTVSAMEILDRWVKMNTK